MEPGGAWVRAKGSRVRNVSRRRLRSPRDPAARNHSHSGRSGKPKLPEKRGRASTEWRTFFASQRALYLQGHFRPAVGQKPLSQSRFRSLLHDSKPAAPGARFARAVSEPIGRINCRYSNSDFAEVASDRAPARPIRGPADSRDFERRLL